MEALSLSSWDRFVVVLPGGPVPPDAGEGSAWAWWTGVLGRGVVKPLFLVLCVGLVEFATRSPLPGWFAFFSRDDAVSRLQLRGLRDYAAVVFPELDGCISPSSGPDCTYTYTGVGLVSKVTRSAWLLSAFEVAATVEVGPELAGGATAPLGVAKVLLSADQMVVVGDFPLKKGGYQVDVWGQSGSGGVSVWRLPCLPTGFQSAWKSQPAAVQAVHKLLALPGVSKLDLVICVDLLGKSPDSPMLAGVCRISDLVAFLAGKRLLELYGEDGWGDGSVVLMDLVLSLLQSGRVVVSTTVAAGGTLGGLGLGVGCGLVGAVDLRMGVWGCGFAGP